MEDSEQHIAVEQRFASLTAVAAQLRSVKPEIDERDRTRLVVLLAAATDIWRDVFDELHIDVRQPRPEDAEHPSFTMYDDGHLVMWLLDTAGDWLGPPTRQSDAYDEVLAQALAALAEMTSWLDEYTDVCKRTFQVARAVVTWHPGTRRVILDPAGPFAHQQGFAEVLEMGGNETTNIEAGFVHDREDRWYPRHEDQGPLSHQRLGIVYASLGPHLTRSLCSWLTEAVPVAHDHEPLERLINRLSEMDGRRPNMLPLLASAAAQTLDSSGRGGHSSDDSPYAYLRQLADEAYKHFGSAVVDMATSFGFDDSTFKVFASQHWDGTWPPPGVAYRTANP